MRWYALPKSLIGWLGICLAVATPLLQQLVEWLVILQFQAGNLDQYVIRDFMNASQYVSWALMMAGVVLGLLAITVRRDKSVLVLVLTCVMASYGALLAFLWASYMTMGY